MISSNGLQHEEVVEVCKCEGEGVTMVRFGLWPASPQFPNVALQFPLLELQRVLQMEAHVPLHAFCKSLKHLTEYSDLTVS